MDAKPTASVATYSEPTERRARDDRAADGLARFLRIGADGTDPDDGDGGEGGAGAGGGGMNDGTVSKSLNIGFAEMEFPVSRLMIRPSIKMAVRKPLEMKTGFNSIMRKLVILNRPFS